MHTDDTDSQLSDILTSYLQNFKNAMGAKLTLIESLLSGSDSLKNNPRFLLSKFSTKFYGNNWQADPHSVIIGVQDIITINRFYIQFRLSSLLSIGEGLFSKDADSFQKELQKVIKKIQLNNQSNLSLGELFLELNGVQNSFIYGILQKVQKKKVLISKIIIDLEIVEEIKHFLREKLIKEQNEGLKEPIIRQHRISLTRDHRLSLPMKTQETSKAKPWKIKNTSFKKEIIPTAMNSFNIDVKPQGEQVKWIDRQDSNFSEESMNIENYVTQKQKGKLKEIYSLMNLEDSNFNQIKRGKGELLSQLEQRNIKIKLYMDSFLSKYERKLRRREKHENNRSTQSSSKKSKGATQKSQDVTIFESKVDSMQNINTLFKNPSDHFKRDDAILQLPQIVSRHYRRITLEK